MGILFLLPFVMACALCDLKTKRIPNPLILCGLSGVLLSRFQQLILYLLSDSGSFSSSGKAHAIFTSLADGCAGFLLPWLLFGVLAVLKMIGGGDVKLLSVIGLQLGARQCLTLIWYTLIIAAIWSAVLVIRRRSLTRRFGYLYRYIGHAIINGKPDAYRSHALNPSGNDSGEFCLAVPILFALFVVLCTPSA